MLNVKHLYVTFEPFDWWADPISKKKNCDLIQLQL